MEVWGGVTISKTIAQIYIDVDIKERHKAAGTNISQACNEFLKNYFLDEGKPSADYQKEAQVLKVKLAQVQSKLTRETQKKQKEIESRAKKDLKSALKRLKELFDKKQMGNKIAGEEYKALVESTMLEFGLSRDKLMKEVGL